MITSSFGLELAPTVTFSIFLIVSMLGESANRPNTTCFPSSHSHGAHVIKN